MSRIYKISMTELNGAVSFGGGGGGGGGGDGGSYRGSDTAKAVCVGGAVVTRALASSPATKNPAGIVATGVAAGVTAIACSMAR